MHLDKIQIAPWVADLIEDTTTSCFYAHGGVGSGKTFAFVLKHYDWITKNPNCEASWFIEPTYNLVQQAAIPIWQKVLKAVGLVEGKDFKFINSKPQILYIYHDNGKHTVFFQSADRPQYMVAATIGGLTIDEAGEISQDVNVRASQRLRDKNVNFLLKQIGGAPQGINWFADCADFEGYDEELNEKSYRVSTYSNAHNLADGFIDEQYKLYGHNKAKIRSWIFGQFANFFEGQACPEYDSTRDRHSDEADPHIPLTFSWDFNVNPLAWNAWQKFYEEYGYGHGRHVHKSVGESSGNSSLIMDGVAEFAHQFPIKRFGSTQIWIQGDASGHQRSTRAPGSSYDDIVRYMRTAGYKRVNVIAPRSNPPVDLRVEYTNKAFSYGLCKIHTEHNNTNKSLVNTEWADQKRQLKKPSGDMVTHWFDAAGYYLFYELKDTELAGVPRTKVISR